MAAGGGSLDNLVDNLVAEQWWKIALVWRAT